MSKPLISAQEARSVAQEMREKLNNRNKFMCNHIVNELVPTAIRAIEVAIHTGQYEVVVQHLLIGDTPPHLDLKSAVQSYFNSYGYRVSDDFRIATDLIGNCLVF